MVIPAASLILSCTGLRHSFGFISDTDRRDPLCGLKSIPHSNFAQNSVMERTLQLRLTAWIQHRKQQSASYKLNSVGVECGARACFRRWERPSRLIGQLLPAQAGQPQASRMLSRHGRLPHWVRGTQCIRHGVMDKILLCIRDRVIENIVLCIRDGVIVKILLCIRYRVIEKILLCI